MHLIIDSGSTKTDYRWIEDGIVQHQDNSLGINPFLQSPEDILATLSKVVHKGAVPSHIYFYGAGCTAEKSVIVKEQLSILYPKAHIEVASDLLGAARSLLQHEPGIACILGTGSNSCYYDGEVIVKNVSPLGFILGDEGSGAVIGKHLVSDIMKGIAPQNVVQQFYEETKLSASEIMDHVYKQPFPNRYLAQFTKHIYDHRKESYFQNLLVQCFDQFFKRNISQYSQDLDISFIGSIAYHFREELNLSALRNNYSIKKIEKSPMEGLIEFHKSVKN